MRLPAGNRRTLAIGAGLGCPTLPERNTKPDSFPVNGIGAGANRSQSDRTGLVVGRPAPIFLGAAYQPKRSRLK